MRWTWAASMKHECPNSLLTAAAPMNELLLLRSSIWGVGEQPWGQILLSSSHRIQGHCPPHHPSVCSSHPVLWSFPDAFLGLRISPSGLQLEEGEVASIVKSGAWRWPWWRRRCQS